MLKITIDLISALDGTTKTIGTMFISNRGDRKKSRGKFNYDVTVMRRGYVRYIPQLMRFDATSKTKVTRRGEVLDYPAPRLNVWRLVSRALLSAFPEENKTKR